jgi:hypothetical protein
VFSITFLNLALKATELSDPRFPTAENPGPRVGVLEGQLHRTIKGRQGATFEVPAAARSSRWSTGRRRGRCGSCPRRGSMSTACPSATSDGERIAPGQYVVAVDVMGGEDVDTARAAHHAIEVIDHRTLRRWRSTSQEDPDELAEQVLLAALLFNTAWVGAGGDGRLGRADRAQAAIDWRYAKVYTRKKLDERSSRSRTGWAGTPTRRPSR